MNSKELLNEKEHIVETIFGARNEARQFLHLVSSLWRYSADNILLIYAQNKSASCVAGKRAFEALGFKVRDGEKPIHILNTTVKCTDPGSYAIDDAGEQIMIKDGVPQYYPEPVYESDYQLVPAYDISQLEGQLERASTEKPDILKLCHDAGVPVLGVDKFPESWSYYNAYYDEGEKKILFLKSVKGDAKTSAIVRAYVQFTLSGDNLMDLTPGTGDVFEIPSKENAAELIGYCIEVHLGIRPSVSNVGVIFQNAAKELDTHEKRYAFLSAVCLFVQRIIQDIEGYPLTVEETNIINCLMNTDNPKLLQAIYMRMDNQEGISDDVKRVIGRVFEQLIGPVSEEELSAIYDDRLHKNIFTYPPYYINVDPPIFASVPSGDRSQFLPHEEGISR